MSCFVSHITYIMRKTINILGVYFDTSSKDALLRQIQILVNKNRKFYIVTPNPEQVMLADSDVIFKKILNSADVSLPDGIGIVAAHKFLSMPSGTGFMIWLRTFKQGLVVGSSILFNRDWLEKDLKVIRGREFFLDLIKLANKKGWRVYFLGGEGNEAVSTQRKIERSYKNIIIRSNPGPRINNKGIPISEKDKQLEDSLVREIESYKPHLLFAAFGAPKQEKWIYSMKGKLNIRGAMAVGVTFKYIEGSAKLPPKIISRRGLEWLWRLLTGSQKIERIVNAFPRFPLAVFRNKLSKLG